MRHAFLWAALASCGDKEATSTAAPVEAKGSKAAPVPGAPTDATSQKFASALVALSVSDFNPSDSSGAKIVYSHLAFGGDGHWSAVGYIEADFEKIDCSEGGTWSMEPATSDTTATVTWKTETTDCAGREAGETRVEFTITPDGKLDTKFR